MKNGEYNKPTNYLCDDKGNLKTLQIGESRKMYIFHQTVQWF